MKALRSFFTIVTWQTVIIAILSVTSTAICIHYNFKAEFPLTLVATAVIFPIVFSIGGAYKRRETALKDYAEIKGYLRAIFLVSRDWLDKPKPENVSKMKTIINDLFANIKTLFVSPIEELPKNEEVSDAV